MQGLAKLSGLISVPDKSAFKSEISKRMKFQNSMFRRKNLNVLDDQEIRERYVLSRDDEQGSFNETQEEESKASASQFELRFNEYRLKKMKIAVR